MATTDSLWNQTEENIRGTLFTHSHITAAGITDKNMETTQNIEATKTKMIKNIINGYI